MLSNHEFQRAVEEALDSLPEDFARLLQNVAVVIEDEPTDEDLEMLDDECGEGCEDLEPGHDHEDDELLGIYRGVPLPERTYDMTLLPDQIAIFRGPILRVCDTRRQAVREIRDTVIHELGHYFGLADEEMEY